ncbi:DUF2540 domain-containing protein [Methanocaldococcus sp. 28A]
MKAAFSLCKNIDSRMLRYYIHKLEHLGHIDPLKLKEVIEAKKKYRKIITLSNKEAEILSKYGKASNLYINYLMLVDGDEE